MISLVESIKYLMNNANCSRKQINREQFPFQQANYDQISQQTKDRNVLKMTKGIYEKSTANTIFNGIRLNAVSLRLNKIK